MNLLLAYTNLVNFLIEKTEGAHGKLGLFPLDLQEMLVVSPQRWRLVLDASDIDGVGDGLSSLTVSFNLFLQAPKGFSKNEGADIYAGDAKSPPLLYLVDLVMGWMRQSDCGLTFVSGNFVDQLPVRTFQLKYRYSLTHLAPLTSWPSK
jgi:hypothetical protein